MEFKIHEINDIKIAEIISDGIVINNAEEGLDLLGDLYFQGIDNIILLEKSISPDFFNLKTGMAGELLQKFSNYRIGLVIIGDFKNVESTSLADFIFESNKSKIVNFIPTLEDAIYKLTQLN